MAGYTGPLAGDVDETAVMVTIVGWRDRREASWSGLFLVHHLDDEIVDVRLPDGWRAICRAVGLDDESPDTEGYLATLAKLAFARRTVGR